MENQTINPETIWDETYKSHNLYFDGGCVTVYTAIHPYGGEPRANAELQIYINSGAVTAKVGADLSPDQMESLAALLTAAASRRRDLDARLAAHKSAEQANEVIA